MLSPSRGFCYCLPVRPGALVVSFLACLGSAILAGVTFRALAIISEHITTIQTAGFYLTSVSWLSLALFSLIGFISIILQHPLLLTIFARFLVYHLPANLLCNLFFTIVLFHSYLDAEVVSRSFQCTRGSPDNALCVASVSLQTMAWVYLWILAPAAVAQIYIYVIIRRFMFVISGEWALEQEHAVEIQKRLEGEPPDRKRRTTITHSIGHGGRRRAKAELWFTMETPKADESFLPSMALSPIAFQTPPRSPVPRGLPPSPRPRYAFPPIAGGSPKSSLRPGTPVTMSNLSKDKDKDLTSDRSARLDMDFCDPEPAAADLSKSEASLLGKRDNQQGKGKMRESDNSVYSFESAHSIRNVNLASTSK